jgi:hypothetical protein
MPTSGYVKDPDAILDYRFDWSDWLDGDTIVTAAATVTTGATLASQSNTTTAHTVWISGGTAGTRYTVTSRITTAAGRTDDRSIILHVLHR